MASTFYETVGHKPVDQTYSSSMREADTNRKRPYRKPRLMGEKSKRRGGRARLGRMRRGNTNYIVADHERKRAEDVAVSRCIHSRIYICVGHRFKPIMGWFAPCPQIAAANSQKPAADLLLWKPQGGLHCSRHRWFAGVGLLTQYLPTCNEPIEIAVVIGR